MMRYLQMTENGLDQSSFQQTKYAHIAQQRMVQKKQSSDLACSGIESCGAVSTQWNNWVSLLS